MGFQLYTNEMDINEIKGLIATIRVMIAQNKSDDIIGNKYRATSHRRNKSSFTVSSSGGSRMIDLQLSHHKKIKDTKITSQMGSDKNHKFNYELMDEGRDYLLEVLDALQAELKLINKYSRSHFILSDEDKHTDIILDRLCIELASRKDITSHFRNHHSFSIVSPCKSLPMEIIWHENNRVISKLLTRQTRNTLSKIMPQWADLNFIKPGEYLISSHVVRKITNFEMFERLERNQSPMEIFKTMSETAGCEAPFFVPIETHSL